MDSAMEEIRGYCEKLIRLAELFCKAARRGRRDEAHDLLLQLQQEEALFAKWPPSRILIENLYAEGENK